MCFTVFMCDQKGKIIEIGSDPLERVQTNRELFENVITGDESWIFHHNPFYFNIKRKIEVYNRHNYPQSKPVNVKSKGLMSIIVFDCRGVMCHEYISRNQTLDQGSRTGCSLACSLRLFTVPIRI